MNKCINALKKFVAKYGATIACCAFAVVTFTSNSSSMIIYYEPKEPKGIEQFKKYCK